MISWVLVFWLQYPENYTEYNQFKSERECRDAEYVWQRRLNIVKSQLIAECRQRKEDQ